MGQLLQCVFGGAVGRRHDSSSNRSRKLRIASPGRETAAGAVGITVLIIGIAAGAATGGLTVGVRTAGALPFVATAVIAVAAVGLLATGVRRDRSRIVA